MAARLAILGKPSEQSAGELCTAGILERKRVSEGGGELRLQLLAHEFLAR
jgi:hypothetical protein